jgi:hypothetical protein
MMGDAALSDRYIHRIGERRGKLVFVGLSQNRAEQNRVLGVFICDCGKSVEYPAGRMLNASHRTHCGCEANTTPNLKHGMRGTPEYFSWQSMKARCLDPGNKDYPRWGGAGVHVYAAWVDSFEAFYNHIGSRPAGTTLDRIDSNGHYEPGNVRWATAKQQQRNRHTSYTWHIKGEVFDAHADAAARFGVSGHTVWRWVNGQFDRRRGTFTEPRADCWTVPKY